MGKMLTDMFILTNKKKAILQPLEIKQWKFHEKWLWDSGFVKTCDELVIDCKESEEDYISCVSWVTEGNYLAVGDSNGTVDLWDVQSAKLMRSMTGHADRISTMKWNNHVLATGSRRGDLFLHDVRIAEHHISTLEGHSQEVCGT